MDFALTLVDRLAATSSAAWVTFFVGFFEGLAIPFPGAWILALVGGALRHNTERLIWLGFLTATGYSLGAIAPYVLGILVRRWGRLAILPRLGLTEGRLGSLQRWFHRYGEPAVLWSRPFWVGNFASIPAGMAAMPLWRFSLYTFGGILPWALVVLWAGGEAANLLERLGAWSVWVIAAVAIAGLLWVWYRRLHPRQEIGDAD